MYCSAKCMFSVRNMRIKEKFEKASKAALSFLWRHVRVINPQLLPGLGPCVTVLCTCTRSFLFLSHQHTQRTGECSSSPVQPKPQDGGFQGLVSEPACSSEPFPHCMAASNPSLLLSLCSGCLQGHGLCCWPLLCQQPLVYQLLVPALK